MFRKSFRRLALAAVLAGGSMAVSGARDLRAAFEFKLVQTANASNLLPVFILVPDRAEWNGVRRVSERTTFYDHERFRVAVRPKRSGHVYLFCRNNQGEVRLLYPQRGDGDNYVARDDQADLPGDGWFRFDAMAGQEELIVLQSPTPLDDVEQASQVEKYERWTGAGLVVRHIFLEHESDSDVH
jgi:hypothetical protein